VVPINLYLNERINSNALLTYTFHIPRNKCIAINLLYQFSPPQVRVKNWFAESWKEAKQNLFAAKFCWKYLDTYNARKLTLANGFDGQTGLAIMSILGRPGEENSSIVPTRGIYSL